MSKDADTIALKAKLAAKRAAFLADIAARTGKTEAQIQAECEAASHQ